MGIFEKLEFIKSIIIRENPDVIYISQKDKYFYEFLKNELNFLNIKFLFLKSQINYLYHKINGFSLVIHKFFNYLKNDYKEFRMILAGALKKGSQSKRDDKCYIGINAPGNYYYSKELSSIISQLKKNNIRFKLFKYIYYLPPTFRNMKFKWALFFHVKFNIKHLFENSRNKNEIIRYVRASLEEYAFIILKEIFFNEINRMIYIIKAFTYEIESSNYKVIIILNEFGAPGKIACYVGNDMEFQFVSFHFVAFPAESPMSLHILAISFVSMENWTKFI